MTKNKFGIHFRKIPPFSFFSQGAEESWGDENLRCDASPTLSYKRPKPIVSLNALILRLAFEL